MLKYAHEIGGILRLQKLTYKVVTCYKKQNAYTKMQMLNTALMQTPLPQRKWRGDILLNPNINQRQRQRHITQNGNKNKSFRQARKSHSK
jgi:hypothetical protein